MLKCKFIRPYKLEVTKHDAYGNHESQKSEAINCYSTMFHNFLLVTMKKIDSKGKTNQ